MIYQQIKEKPASFILAKIFNAIGQIRDEPVGAACVRGG
jgi:hypothetical protein